MFTVEQTAYIKLLLYLYNNAINAVSDIKFLTELYACHFSTTLKTTSLMLFYKLYHEHFNLITSVDIQQSNSYCSDLTELVYNNYFLVNKNKNKKNDFIFNKLKKEIVFN